VISLISGTVAAMVGAVLGALVGGFVTWKITKSAAEREARRDTLVQAGNALQEFQVAYAQFYGEFLSPEAMSVRGHWAKMVEDKPDPVYLELMAKVDSGKGRLRMVHGLLYGLFPRGDVDRLGDEVMKLLMITGDPPAHCRDVDNIANRACDMRDWPRCGSGWTLMKQRLQAPIKQVSSLSFPGRDREGGSYETAPDRAQSPKLTADC